MTAAIRPGDCQFFLLIFLIGNLQVSCGMCLMAANTMLIWIHEGATKEELVERIVTLCITMNIQKEHICKGIAEAHAVCC